MASLEGGIGALEVSSGHAAQITAILTICEAGDHIVSSSTLYGGTVTQLKYSLPKLGIQTTLVDLGDPENFRRAIHPASTTHSQLSETEQLAAGVSPDLIRLSVGLEDIEDILWDLDQALNA
jgi:O-acetylhomoserine/O-acetylserine sulfhydrylase-like pyridoxal-dependent enzyme